MTYSMEQIGTIKTPYLDHAPYQPVEEDQGNFSVIINNEYVDGLKKLKTFHYAFLIYYANRVVTKKEMFLTPPWTDGKKIGVFASRSPDRPNPIGLSIVRIKNIVGNTIHTSGLDVFNDTPLLDIKPYIKDLDDKSNANYGWIEELDDMEHLTLHIKGIPHDY